MSHPKKAKRTAAKPQAVVPDPSGGLGPTTQEIATRAYLIWEKRGKPIGRDREHWSQAEAELKAEVRAEYKTFQKVVSKLSGAKDS